MDDEQPSRKRGGPLEGLRIIELAGIGPGPFGAMLLADLGADVIRIDKPTPQAGNPIDPEHDVLNRGRRSIVLDLKDPADREIAMELIDDADALLEGFRPGVTERLGLGPSPCMARNPRLVYGRMTGWGQNGPLAMRAGHDINYIAIAGALEPIGPAGGNPAIPLNLVGDFGGGGMLLAFGVVSAIWNASRTGVGQVVDASIVDGTALLTTMLHAWRAQGMWGKDRGHNLLDGGAHYYHVYETSDGHFLSVGAVEPQFYEHFIHGLGELNEGDWLVSYSDEALWPKMVRRIEEIVRSRTLREWEEIFEGVDACVAPVLSPGDAPAHGHNAARNTFLELGGIVQPAPAPRFSVTPASVPTMQPTPGQHTEEILKELKARGRR